MPYIVFPQYYLAASSATCKKAAARDHPVDMWTCGPIGRKPARSINHCMLQVLKVWWAQKGGRSLRSPPTWKPSPPTCSGKLVAQHTHLPALSYRSVGNVRGLVGFATRSTASGVRPHANILVHVLQYPCCQPFMFQFLPQLLRRNKMTPT